MAVCCSATSLNPQSTKGGNVDRGSRFLIDESKPYLYLELDHVGPRRPLREGEPTTGIWLKLKNNCEVTVVILALGVKSDTEALSVADEVVPDPHAEGTGDMLGEGVLIPNDLKGMTDVFRSPNENESEVRSAEDTARKSPQDAQKNVPTKRPHGYNSGYQPRTEQLMEVLPGHTVLFSLPLNHVGDNWHLEIPFRFAFKHEGGAWQPYSYLQFSRNELPTPDNKEKVVSSATQPAAKQ
jgi:hypothetical protein